MFDSERGGPSFCLSEFVGDNPMLDGLKKEDCIQSASYYVLQTEETEAPVQRPSEVRQRKHLKKRFEKWCQKIIRKLYGCLF
jgi:hypothetical protein